MLDEMHVEVMNDDYGRESVEIKVPYRGALRMGSAQNVQFHLSADEELAFEPVTRPLLHPYQDAPAMECRIRAYALEEVLAEKLRAAAGQRRHAVARDIYDIASVVRRGADAGAALSALPGKAAYKGVDLSDAAARFRAREDEYAASWDRTLEYLVVDDLSFGGAFSVTAGLLGKLQTESLAPSHAERLPAQAPAPLESPSARLQPRRAPMEATPRERHRL